MLKIKYFIFSNQCISILKEKGLDIFLIYQKDTLQDII